MSATDLLREGLAAYSRRDPAMVDTYFAEDIAWRGPESFGQPLAGREAVRAFLAGMAEATAVHEITLEDAIEVGDRLLVQVRHRMVDHAGRVVSFEAHVDWRHRDGRFTSMHEIADTLPLAIFLGLVPAPAGAGV